MKAFKFIGLCIPIAVVSVFTAFLLVPGVMM